MVRAAVKKYGPDLLNQSKYLMRNWINLITEFQLKDVEQMLTTGGGGEPPKPPEDGGDPWDDDNGGGDDEPPKEPLYDNKLDFHKLDEFTRNYLEAMLWTEEERIADDGWLCYFSSIHSSAIDSSVNDCHAFQRQNADTLEDAFDHGYSMSQAGHDFWLTRNHHGAGFWDRNELRGGLGKKLTDEAQKFGECSVGAGDQGEIYVD